MLESILVFMLVLVAIMLIGIILVQSGQGDMGAAMGGNTMNQAFGSEGADKLLVRITTTLATIFMVLAISIHLVDQNKNEDPDKEGLPSIKQEADIPDGLTPNSDTDTTSAE